MRHNRVTQQSHATTVTNARKQAEAITVSTKTPGGDLHTLLDAVEKAKARLGRENQQRGANS
jgi:hypothetical protein